MCRKGKFLSKLVAFEIVEFGPCRSNDATVGDTKPGCRSSPVEDCFLTSKGYNMIFFTDLLLIFPPFSLRHIPRHSSFHIPMSLVNIALVYLTCPPFLLL